MNQKEKKKEELIEKSESSNSEKEEESDEKALNFLQKIKSHKNKNNNIYEQENIYMQNKEGKNEERNRCFIFCNFSKRKYLY